MVGVASVVISMLFVGYELRQSNRIAIAMAEQSVLALMSDSHEVSLDVESGQALFRSKLRTADFDELEGEDFERLNSFALRTWNNWTAVQSAYDQGLMQEDLFLGFIDDVEKFLQTYPVTQEIFIDAWKTYPTTQHWEIYGPIARLAIERGVSEQ